MALSATWELGEAAKVLIAVLGEPAIAMTVAVMLPLPAPKLAVIVFEPAEVVRSVVFAAPAAVVVPLAVERESPAAPEVKAMAAFGTALEKASYTSASTAEVATLSATNVLGEAVNTERLALGLPATKVTAWVSVAAPAVAVTVFVSATTAASVVEYDPLPFVLPFGLATTSPAPLLATCTDWATTGFP